MSIRLGSLRVGSYFFLADDIACTIRRLDRIGRRTCDASRAVAGRMHRLKRVLGIDTQVVFVYSSQLKRDIHGELIEELVA